jgi:sec-independent protein translocase protein TatB
MLDLSPLKLLIIFVVAMILLGPDKVPQMARQIGAAWHGIRKFQQRVQQEMHDTVPDIPTEQITKFARSPVSFLNSLADMHLNEELKADPGATAELDPPEGGWLDEPLAPDPGAPSGPSPTPLTGGPVSIEVPDDPSLN